MKKIFSVLTLVCIVGINQVSAQNYYRQFFPIKTQPALDSIVSSGANDDYIYLLSRKRKSAGVDSAAIRFYDGLNWFNSGTFNYKGKAERVIYYQNEYYVSGVFKDLNGISAPSGSYYSLIRLKGNTWDTVPGTLLNDTVRYTSAACNDEGIYIVNEVSKKLSNFFLYKKDSGFTQKFKIVTNILSYDRLWIDARGKLLLAYSGMGSSITSVNGKSVGACFQISNGVISTPGLGGGGAVIGASVSYKNEIFYIREYGPMMQVYNGSSNKNITANLGTKVFGGFPPFLTRDEVMMPGVLNGIANTLIVLDKDSTNWADIQLGKNGFGLLYSKSLGIFSYDIKTITLKKLDRGGVVAGKMYFDKDSTCTYDTSELLIGNQVLVFKGDLGNTYTMTDDNGFYSVSSGADILSVEAVNKNFRISPCSLLEDTITTGSFKNKDLPFHNINEQDLEGKIAGSFRARWGDTIQIRVGVRNQGSNKRNGRVRLTIPADVDYVSSSPAATVSGNVLEWKLSNLKAFGKAGFSVRVGVNRTKLKVGDHICYQLRVDTFKMESDTFNNFDTLCQLVVASFDPNSKESLPEGAITYSPKKINYVINFQNLGSDFARHVVIRDTLTGYLNVEQLKITESSHPCKISLENNVLVVSFNDINLDYAKHNVEASKGWVAFSITPSSAIKPNTSIKNKAYIYFDYNPAIITNESIVTVVNGTNNSIQQTLKSTVLLYPNPANNFFTIDQIPANNQRILVYNMQGILVYDTRTDGLTNIKLDIHNWSSGIYFVKTDTETFRCLKID